MENMTEQEKREYRARLIEKWMPIIDPTSARTDAEKKIADRIGNVKKMAQDQYYTMACVLENSVRNDRGALTEGSTSADAYSTGYTPILIPMIRRVMPSLIGMNIFGVQPMSMPTGYIFAIRGVYTNNKTNPVAYSASQVLTLADASAFAVGDPITTAGGKKGTIRYKEGNNVLVENVTGGAFIATDSVDDADPFSAGATTVSAVYNNETQFQVIFNAYTGSYTTAAGEALSTDMPEIGFNVDRVAVEAKTRKLKAQWSIELQEDAQAVHGMDIESTLSNLAVNEITLERNREDMALLDTKATAGGVITFNYNSGPDGRWEVEKYQNLIAAISRARNDVLVASRRGPANFAVVSPDVLTALEMSGKLSTVGTDVQQSAYVGRLLGSMDVYCDQYATSNHVTVGYKGPGEEDAGIFIAPYKPITITKATGQDDGQQRLFFHTRYGLADNPFGAANYYRKISVTNLPN